jgi:hypothetical protein
MALTKIPSELSSTTGIVDNSNATAITIDSSENVGIGTSPLYPFHVQMPSDGSTGAVFRYIGGTNNPGLFFSTNESTTDCVINATGSTSANLVFSTTSERMRIDSSGNVGIGTISPSTYGGKLNITDGTVGGESTLVVANNNNNQFIRVGINGDVAQIAYDDVDSLAFGEALNSTTSGLTTERMRIDSSGNVGIGTTSDVTSTNAGVQLRADNTIRVAKSGASAMSLYRHTNDGSIISFYKDGSAVGSIGSVAGVSTYIHGGTGYSGLTFGNDEIIPCNESGATRDNAIDLGDSSGRFKDIYFSGDMYGDSLRAGESLPSSTDFNDLKTSGFYRVDNNATNAPSTTYHALVIYGNSSNVVTQIATSLASTTTYVRSFNTVWTSWARLDT